MNAQTNEHNHIKAALEFLADKKAASEIASADDRTRRLV